ncbi:hypothetical protein ACFLVN_06000 [Chloroflexota bacterium]
MIAKAYHLLDTKYHSVDAAGVANASYERIMQAFPPQAIIILLEI